MPSSFYGLEISKTGLFVSRQSLDVTGHNIANANTKGYTRQRLHVSAIDPYMSGARFLPAEQSIVGAGVRDEFVEQIRNAFLDTEYRRENSELGYWETKAEELEFVETILNETSDDSISNAMADFFGSLQELTKDPVNKEIRTIVQQNGIKMAESINHTYEQLVELQRMYDDSMQVVVQDINDHLTNIVNYNEQIYAFELSGEPANDLRDKRNVLLDELSELVNIEYLENADGQLQVNIEGVNFIDHTTVSYLETADTGTGVVSGEPNFTEIFYEGTATPFVYSSGKLEAYRYLRDENAADSIGIPRILDQLNTLARSLAEEFNTVHAAGYTMPYNAVPSQTGINLFHVPAGGYGDVTAGNLRLSDEVLDNSYHIAASSVLIDMSAANPQQNNNENALDLVDLTSRTDLPTVSNFENYLKSFVVSAAIESAHNASMKDSQSVIVMNIETRRQSISGVSIDEEMVQMVKFQHSYTAASRMITTVDEALDVLINRTGMVGR